MSRTKLFGQLTQPQQVAILKYAEEKGKGWKGQLANDWQRSQYSWNHPGESAYLEEVWNALGPSWLADVKLPNKEKRQEILGYSVLIA